MTDERSHAPSADSVCVQVAARCPRDSEPVEAKRSDTRPRPGQASRSTEAKPQPSTFDNRLILPPLATKFVKEHVVDDANDR
ncbi:unnamed protein product [Soboliphyme baturini]|uniref:DUF397 domain-containing protein n=1 Tax=Soboliphyme baturini TaxID=241478 RepID=A0A183IX99_9BILA|nr:unnamed protein product [Soboliphyme baturini]